MAHTFKVGDIVRGISRSYGITNDLMTRGLVTAIDNHTIDVRVLEQAEGICIGMTFEGLLPERFELVGAAAPAPHRPVRILYNPPATVVFWSDGSKTVAKCAPHERFDREKGLAIACAKKLLGEGYAEAFKAFEKPGNRVLSWDEACALEYGVKVWVEDRDAKHESAVHAVKLNYFCGKVLEDALGLHYHISDKHPRFNKGWRVWSLPQPPTSEELAANPWNKEDK